MAVMLYPSIALRCKLRGGNIADIYFTAPLATDKYIVSQMTWYLIIAHELEIDFVWTRERFPVKQITQVTIITVRDIKNEDQMKSTFFSVNLSSRKTEVSFCYTSVR